MKRIIRLTESDLTRIVKRVIREHASNGANAFETIKKGMEGLGTDENMVAKGVYMIKSKADYQECLTLVRKAGFNTIMAWIATDMSFQKESDSSQGVKDIVGNNSYLRQFSKHLVQFNPSETIVH